MSNRLTLRLRRLEKTLDPLNLCATSSAAGRRLWDTRRHIHGSVASREVDLALALFVRVRGHHRLPPAGDPRRARRCFASVPLFVLGVFLSSRARSPIMLTYEDAWTLPALLITYDLSLLDHIKGLCGKQRQRATRLFFLLRSRVPGVLILRLISATNTRHPAMQKSCTVTSGG